MARPALVANHPVARCAQAARVNPTLVVQRNKGWQKVHEEGRCRMCQRSSFVRPLTRHHIVPLSYFRRHPQVAPLRHSDANIVGLCEPCHRLVEKDPHARVELRRVLGAAEIAFVIQLVGQTWLDRRYPTTPQAIVAHETDLQPDILDQRRRYYRAQARRVYREGLGDTSGRGIPIG